ncbi:tripartite tricarboxylate transporter substrate binding protein [Ottowia sp. GY511]|uniref:Bug family tripartite tricarboxylate transporter substrate binding protein n=1 Tax=Ottowia flava TaxID=2675430 RepID=A0ABW4KSU9_9BURK|nr:tripartite tricarboxylate transporter substrate binding protein [Ottowia sp. GY511]TXK33105.1 tripartite tricarboxylate transporter substrate binding protein [Ottowia sp. GY511]
MDKRTFLGLLAATAALPSLAQDAAWPSRPIRIITPAGAGGAGDILAREFATRLSTRLGQPVIVDNRPGANGTIATVAAARAPADGHTLLLTLTQHVQAPVQYKDVGYDPFNFTPLTRIGAVVTLLVIRPELGVRNAADLLRLAPGKNWSFGATATGTQVVMEAFNKHRNLGLLSVPYKGEPAALTDLLGGQIDMALATMAGAKPYLQTGKLVPVGISAPQRAKSMPNIPTFAEQGVDDFGWVGWYGFLAPPGLPPAIATRLMAEFKAILEEPGMRTRLEALDMMNNFAEGPAFMADMKRDTANWTALVKRSGLSFDR